jgi:glycosyltransferase involved in cell wall biosynthesis
MIFVGLSKIYGAVRFTAATIRALRRSGSAPDVIHVHSANYLLTGIALKMMFRAPLCLNFGGTELLRAKKIPFYGWMFRFLDTGFYVARSMEPDLRRFLPAERCVYTANGIDHSLFYPDPQAQRGTDIVAVGNLRWQKDYETLIRAFATVAERFPEVRLAIYGQGELRQDLERLTDSLGLQSRVAFQGTRSQAELRHALQTCALYVISSKREGFPKALIEAMACGAPVVATDAGECGNVLEGVSEVVAVGDGVALAEQMMRVLDDQGHRAALSSLCAERSKTYGWSRVCEIVDHRYDEISRSAANRPA